MINYKNLLRSTDGALSAGAGLLDEDMTGVDTSMPILPAGLYECKIESVEEKPNNDKTGQVLKIKLSLVKDAVSTKGEPIKAGFPLFDNIPLTPTEKMAVGQIKKRLAAFMEGVEGTAGTMNPLSKWNGKIVTVKLKISKETDEFPESNRVAQYVNERR